MCISQPRIIAAPPVAPAPTKAQIEAAAAADRLSLVNQSRTAVASRQGVFGNIKTTPMGDASFGSNAVARFA